MSRSKLGVQLVIPRYMLHHDAVLLMGSASGAKTTTDKLDRRI